MGGGATGVEIAGALSEMKRYVIPYDYPDMDGLFAIGDQCLRKYNKES